MKVSGSHIDINTITFILQLICKLWKTAEWWYVGRDSDLEWAYATLNTDYGIVFFLHEVSYLPELPYFSHKIRKDVSFRNCKFTFTWRHMIIQILALSNIDRAEKHHKNEVFYGQNGEYIQYISPGSTSKERLSISMSSRLDAALQKSSSTQCTASVTL